MFLFLDAVAVSQGNFGPGSGQIYLNSLVCTGSESSLLDCPRGYWGVQYCSHLENDAGVICAGKGIGGKWDSYGIVVTLGEIPKWFCGAIDVTI